MGDGSWTATGLAPGVYQIAVSKPGFAAFRRVVSVAAGESRQLQQRLAIGQAVETVTITAPRTTQAAPAAAASTALVGGMVMPLRAVYAPKPEYPDSLRQQGVEGTVQIAAVIGKSGDVVSAQVIAGNPAPPELADLALATVETWHYQPTLLNGVPVESPTTVTITFKLR